MSNQVIYRVEQRPEGRINIVEGTDVWHDPQSGWIGEAKINESSGEIKFTNKIVNLDEYRNTKQLIKQSGAKDVNGLYGFTKEWYEAGRMYSRGVSQSKGNIAKFVELLKQSDIKIDTEYQLPRLNSMRSLMATLKQSASLTMKDYPDLQAEVPTQEGALRVKLPNESFLMNCVTRKTTNSLFIEKAFDFVPAGISRNVGQFTQITPKKGTFAQTQFQGLELDGANIQWHDTYFIPQWKFNILQLHLTYVPVLMEYTKVLKVAERFSEITPMGGVGTDWGLKSGGISTNDPLEDLNDAFDAITGNKGRMQFFASVNQVKLDLDNNTNIKGTNQEGPTMRFVAGNRIERGQVPGVTSSQFYVVDDLLETTSIITGDTAATESWQGPRRTFEYKNDENLYTGRLWYDYNIALLRDAGIIKKISGVSA